MSRSPNASAARCSSVLKALRLHQWQSSQALVSWRASAAGIPKHARLEAASSDTKPSQATPAGWRRHRAVGALMKTCAARHEAYITCHGTGHQRRSHLRQHMRLSTNGPLQDPFAASHLAPAGSATELCSRSGRGPAPPLARNAFKKGDCSAHAHMHSFDFSFVHPVIAASQRCL